MSRRGAGGRSPVSGIRGLELSGADWFAGDSIEDLRQRTPGIGVVWCYVARSSVFENEPENSPRVTC
jgi:hypothetical protein